VAEAGNSIVGWATSSAGRDDDRPAARELEGIYLLRDVYGTGAGQDLLVAAIGDEPAYLWMLDDNPRAEAFYRRNGFERDGIERDQRMAGSLIHVIRMVRSGQDR
jgi:GNAT superfamily N-acetyltransferase